MGGLASVGLEQGKRASTCRPRDAGNRWNNFYLNNFQGYSLILAGRWNPIIRILIGQGVEYLRCILSFLAGVQGSANLLFRVVYPTSNMVGIVF